ncbi:P-type conjugative transfer protein TrbJ [Ramlibacter sp. H39-3-26]|nr:P-type conjugative transfer protein TrbJ [Ramlibacter sp. H39-3-26]MDF1486016.1 P-type conjugative transfer protein TrbJ [Ramlibacter sp. H39-3-26]
MAGAALPARAQFVVTDPGNLAQTTITAIESAAQTLKLIAMYEMQIQQYTTQMQQYTMQNQQYTLQNQQYNNQVQNTLPPSSYIWDQARATIRALLEATDTLRYYKGQLGSLDSYLGKFQDLDYYKASPCFTPAGCSAAEWSAVNSVRELASQSRKKANDALFKGLDLQQDNLQNDAATLERLQAAAQGAIGQMQALGYANQLASEQAHQLLQIRGLLIAQHNALTTQMQAQTDKNAQETAAAIQLRQGSYHASPARNW